MSAGWSVMREGRATWDRTRTAPRAGRRAFSLLEVVLVVIVLGILAAVVVPRFSGLTDEARASACQSALGSVRGAIASFRTSRIISGGDPFPTLAELVEAGTVLEGEMPRNPYNDAANVQAVTQAQAEARSVVNAGAAGWNYYVDNDADPPVAVFYANSAEETTVPDGAGGFLAANEL